MTSPRSPARSPACSGRTRIRVRAHQRTQKGGGGRKVGAGCWAHRSAAPQVTHVRSRGSEPALARALHWPKPARPRLRLNGRMKIATNTRHCPLQSQRNALSSCPRGDESPSVLQGGTRRVSHVLTQARQQKPEPPPETVCHAAGCSAGPPAWREKTLARAHGTAPLAGAVVGAHTPPPPPTRTRPQLCGSSGAECTRPCSRDLTQQRGRCKIQKPGRTHPSSTCSVRP